MKKIDKGIALILHEHGRQLARMCRRKYGGRAVTPAMLLETARELMLQRIERMTRSISHLADSTGTAAESVRQLSAALDALKKGKARRGKKS